MAIMLNANAYRGAINPNSERYKAAKRDLDEVKAANGGSLERTKSKEERELEELIELIKQLKRMLGQKVDNDSLDDFLDSEKRSEENFIRNRMASYDEDGDWIDPTTGMAGLLANGIPESERHKIIDISEQSRQEMFDETKRHFIQECGVANGDTTRRTEVFNNYQRSVGKQDRLRGSWTLGQYERAYRQAFYDAVKASNPDWELGWSFDASVLDGITRESIDSRMVKTSSTSLELQR